MIVIGLLRFLGLLNAAVWFGATFFFIFISGPATTHSDGMRELLGAKSFPYFSIAISQVIGARFYGLFLVCALLAMLHMGAEWLYFGKYPRRIWLVLIFGLFIGGLAQTYGLQPRIKQMLLLQHSASSSSEQRRGAEHSGRLWRAASTGVDLILLSGLGIYLWRLSDSPDEMRFVGASNLPGKFRS